MRSLIGVLGGVSNRPLVQEGWLKRSLSLAANSQLEIEFSCFISGKRKG